MGTKTSQLQIRVTSEQKAVLKRLAAAAGQSLSSYVLAQVIPSTELRFGEIVRELRSTGGDHPAALRDLGTLLAEATERELSHGLNSPGLSELSPPTLNYVAAMIEQAAHDRGVSPPRWVSRVRPLERPHFMWALKSLRPHQIRVTPAAFKRRNLFLDPLAAPRV